ncbi:MAG: hypothetical protein QXV27_06820 [Candidatus Caldarchaeum sp.]
MAGGYRSNWEETSEYVIKHNIPWTVVYDGGMDVFGKYSVKGTPTYIAISPSGEVVGRLEGEQQYTVLERLVKTSLSTP